MLDVRKNTYSKNYENSFFRDFARHLSIAFKEKDKSGLLLGSPVCMQDEKLQIDALLITEHVVCLIDFKNYEGLISLPSEKEFELGIWTNERCELIKGGSSINPFIQLKNQKKRFLGIFDKHILRNLAASDKFNPYHTVRIVCFQGEIYLKGKIPSTETLNFFIFDKLNFLEGILDIIDVSDKEVSLTSNSYSAFKQIFQADEFKIDDKPLEDKLKCSFDKLNYQGLYVDQKGALAKMKSFLEDPTQNVFVLRGTANSGKSYLIPYIRDIASKAGRETKIFAISSRVVNNLISSIDFEIQSIYAYIYGGNEPDHVEKNVEENPETEDDQEEIQLESIPLKNCADSENALFIVDEAQLVLDSFYQSFDLIFGSGYVLKDFIRFADLKKMKRKIVFIGDPYQLYNGKSNGTSLNPSYLEEKYSLKVSAYELLDKPEYSFINEQALICANGIREHLFNLLQFRESESFIFLKREQFKDKIVQLIKEGKGHLLYFRNSDSQKANLWIKEKILQNGINIAKGDLVYFNNNISVEDIGPIPKRVFNGQFATVLGSSIDIISKPIFQKEKLIAIMNFREVSLKILDNGNEVTVLSLENYMINPKAELCRDELLAYKIYLYQLAEEERGKFESGEYRVDEELRCLFDELKKRKKVKVKVNRKIQALLSQMPSTPFYKFKNIALLRFGWAMTVHKSMSYKWDEIIFNVDQGENVGKMNEQYFEWLYTGISRAKQKVSLINYKSISPFDKTNMVDSSKEGVKLTDFFYIAQKPDSPDMLRELKEFIISKTCHKAIKVDKVDSFPWQEKYYFRQNDNVAIVLFSYDKQGKFRNPRLISGDNNLGNEIIQVLLSSSGTFKFDIVKEQWREKSYESLASDLALLKIRFIQIVQTKYKDKIKLANEKDQLDIDVDYNADNVFTKITAIYYSNSVIWEDFQNSITKKIG